MSISQRASSVVVFLFFVLAVAVFIPAPSYGQAANAGSVAGLVTDSSGATVVAATVTLTDRATSTSRVAASNDAGRYTFANVAPGAYEITASKTGFRVVKVADLQVTVGTPDGRFQVGSWLYPGNRRSHHDRR